MVPGDARAEWTLWFVPGMLEWAVCDAGAVWDAGMGSVGCWSSVDYWNGQCGMPARSVQAFQPLQLPVRQSFCV